MMDDDGDDKDDTKRRTRNLSEKKRRDQFNMLVHELSTMISTNSRKMDKSTVLKSTISFLKNHNEITVRSRAHDVQEEWKPAFLSNEEFTYLLLEALEGFVMVFSSTGRICYVSESITSILGHNPAKLVNNSLFDFTCEEDRPFLYNLLQRNVTATEQIQSVSKEKEMITFELHLKRGELDFRDETTYELVSFNGHFRTNIEQLNGDHGNRQQNMETSILFVGTGRLHTPQLIRDVSLLDPNRGDFTSRHSLEWKFLFLDHRAPPIIGYLPFEVLGTSGYDYYHFDDLEKVVACHEELMQKGELTSCYYRFLTKGQQWIWLQTRFYITYHQWNSKPEFVVCTHRVISYADMAQGTKEESGETDNISVNKNTDMKPALFEESAPSSMSPSYMSEASDAFSSSYATHSPTTLHSGDVMSHIGGESSLAPQHGIGAQYLENVPCVGLGAMGEAGVLPLPLRPVPVLVSPDQAQIQLQRKHEELHQMIVRQQEELLQVKEQLLLARLGILQPVINVPYVNPEQIQPQQQQVNQLPPQIQYETLARVPSSSYPALHPPHPSPHPSPHPPHTPGSHHRMPQ